MNEVKDMNSSKARAWVVAFLIGLSGFAIVAEGKVVYVAKTGNDANDGLSWTTAKLTVQAGLNTAVANDQVWVAAGTYVERITLKADVALYSGFAGNETDLAGRNWTANKAILDGNAQGTVVIATGVTASTRIDGFTIRNGKAVNGGGIRCVSSALIIANNVIMGNAAEPSGYGGGIYCSGGPPTLMNNTIRGNRANFGGGFYCDGASPTMTNDVIIGNIADDGGGVYCNKCSAIIENATIVGNTASKDGGGVYCPSGPTIANTIIAYNSSGVFVTHYPSSPSVRFSCAYGNLKYNYRDMPDPTGINGNISADPKLVDIVYGDVHIQPDSPCKDAGDDTAAQAGRPDIDGQSRIQGDHVDIGADESDGTVRPAAVPVIVRVSPAGDNRNNGSSWRLAKRTVQGGIDASEAVGGAEVWVAAGTYRERITLKFGIHVFGGFAGTEESRDLRNWVTNETILDGGGAGSVVTASAAGYGSTTIDGFTIRNGLGTLGTTGRNGGGVYCPNSSPTIARNRITGNDADDGGGIYCSGGYPVIVNNVIMGNGAWSGGGIYSFAASPTISNNTVIGNFREGIRWYHGGPVIANTIVAFNGGSGVVGDDASTPVFQSNCIYQNTYPGTVTGGSIDIDPRFIRTPSSGADEQWATDDDDYGDLHLQAGSPCVDAGDNSLVPAGFVTDLDGGDRFLEGLATPDTGSGTPPIVDIGAYEYIPPIAIRSAVSVKTHGAAGELPIDILAPGAVEPRRGGPTRLVISFNGSAQPQDGTLVAGDEVAVSNGAITALSISGAQLIVDLSGVADATCLTISLQGISRVSDGTILAPTTLKVRTLMGDVNGDGVVNLADLRVVRDSQNRTATIKNVHADVTMDGKLDLADMVAIRNNMNRRLATCP